MQAAFPAVGGGFNCQPNLRLFRTPTADITTVTEQQVAMISVVELPFRVRLGRFWRAPMNADGSVEIALLNRVLIPKRNGARIEDVPWKRDRKLLNTRLAVVENPVRKLDGSIAEVRSAANVPSTLDAKAVLDMEAGPQLLIWPEFTEVFDHIQRFIKLYFFNCPPEFSSHGIRSLSITEFLNDHIVFATCLTDRNCVVPTKFIRDLLAAENSRSKERDMGALFLTDDAAVCRRKLKSALVGDREDLVQDLYFLSVSYSNAHNMHMALITIVAAMEAAVAQFAPVGMDPVLGEELRETLLREQGMSAMIAAIPKLFFPRNPAVTDELVAMVQKALTARNHLMHGVHKRGKPKIGTLTSWDIGERVHACEKMIKILRAETLRLRPGKA